MNDLEKIIRLAILQLVRRAMGSTDSLSCSTAALNLSQVAINLELDLDEIDEGEDNVD